MTLKQLQDKVRVELTSSHGQYKVTINYRGKEYKCHSNNSEAYDVIRAWLRDEYFYSESPCTPKHAYICLWDECKAANGLK